MLTRGETVGVFQLESMGMRKALIGMRPDRFEDIIALVALYRPGPMENIPIYNARKNGEEEPDYIHPTRSIPGLTETYGVIVYQEQVMQIAQDPVRLFARRSGSAAPRHGQEDPLGNGRAARALRQRCGRARALPRRKANEIFDLLAKFADYGFNKIHAAAYALVSYQTAWMKANYPVEFLAASMQLDIGNTDKLAIFRQEAASLGIEVVPPSVQTSQAGFDVRDGKIFYALAAIKGVGEGGSRADRRGSRSERAVPRPYRFLHAD